MATTLLRAPSPRSQVAEKLRGIAVAQARLERLRAQLEEELDAVRRCQDRRIGALRARVERQLAELEAFCRAERGVILPADRKTFVTPHGEVGFRKSEPVIRVRDGLAEEDVCRLLRRARLKGLLRIKEAPDKPALHKALCEGRLSPGQLGRFGLELEEGEERFHYRLREQTSEGSPAPGGGRR